MARSKKTSAFEDVFGIAAMLPWWAGHYAKNASAFHDAASADSILAKLSRLCERINGTGH
ncbi:hypothetical protein [Cupriavidus sp. 8B]